MVVVWLGLIGAGISAYVGHKQATPGRVVCLGSGCAAVIRSRYGRLLGIPNGILGVAYFLAMAAVPLLGPWLPGIRPLALLATSAALVLYLYLTYLQFFVLRALCNWCLMSAGLTAMLFWILVTG